MIRQDMKKLQITTTLIPQQLVIMNCIYDGTDDVDYEHINITIIDGNVTSMSLVISKGNFGANNDKKGYTSWHGYCIIIFNSTKYTLQEDLNIYGQVVFYGEFYVTTIIFCQ